MDLSRDFVEWFLSLAGGISFQGYTQLAYWDLYFKAYKIAHDDQMAAAKRLVQTRLFSSIVSLAYPVECVSTHTTGGGMVAIVWENGAVALADEPTLESYKGWVGEGVLHG